MIVAANLASLWPKESSESNSLQVNVELLLEILAELRLLVKVCFWQKLGAEGACSMSAAYPAGQWPELILKFVTAAVMFSCQVARCRSIFRLPETR